MDAITSMRMDTPIGVLTLSADGDGLRRIDFPSARPGPAAAAGGDGRSAILQEARRQLDAYFAGRRRHFDLPLSPQGTAFQREVWSALASIPYGGTWSYRELARHIGRPMAMRAVGAANGRNPLPIVLPCHRVIGASGALTGFSGGLSTKAFLLRLEATLPRERAERLAASASA